MSTELLNHLKNLSEIKAPCGTEDAAREYLANELISYVEKLWVDNIGNLIGTIGPNGAPEILISAHMDEVGLIVKNIDDYGSVYFEKLGIIDDKVLPGIKVGILTSKGLVHGVIGTKSSHLQTEIELNRFPNYREMYIDLGIPTKKEAEELGVIPGCPIAFESSFQCLANNIIIGKSLDNRIGCAVMLETLKELSKTNIFEKVKISILATVQEEIGARGAAVGCYDLNPAMAIVLDTVPCENLIERENFQTVLLGEGPVIRTFDMHLSSMLGFITPRIVKDILFEAATSAGIKFQIDSITGTYLDSAKIHISQRGIPTGSICIPRRYAHSPIEVADFKDVEASIVLTIEAIKKFANNPPSFNFTIK